MATALADTAIGEYLRERLMPVEGVIPHLEGIDMYGTSVPAELAGGDLFEYINFKQRYDLDARIRRAVLLSQECLQAHRMGAPDYIRYVHYSPGVRRVLVRSGTGMFFASALLGLLPSLAHRISGSPIGYGVLLGGFGAGAVLGAFFSACAPDCPPTSLCRRELPLSAWPRWPRECFTRSGFWGP